MFQNLPHFLCTFSELLLKLTDQLIILAFGVLKVVVG